ncbi:MAG: hypothetical protein F8N15_07260, partial [Methanobacterium sp.]|nr:hypothetical protein [Methanobacterium sp.]
MVEFAPHIVILDGSVPDDRQFLGGKAASLNALVRAGLPVPPAFCVTVEACRTMMA